MDYDALLLVSFGGPEGPQDVMPFLENVTRGKNVPRQRLEEVAEHYYLFDGVSPLNEQLRALLTALVGELNARGPHLTVYWGNRFWHPLLEDTLRQMADDGVHRALAFATSAFGSPPGCRAYSEDIERARQAIGSAAPEVEKLRLFYNHPGFIEAMADRVRHAMGQLERAGARVLFTAHSIPAEMAARCPYQRQLQAACGLVAERLGGPAWELVYQSRSGRPTDEWLGPSIGQRIDELAGEGVGQLVVAPIGFMFDHMEVIYDLDVEVAEQCDELGLTMIRSGTVGCHPRVVEMIRQLALERLDPSAPRLAVGSDGPPPDVCDASCCR